MVDEVPFLPRCVCSREFIHAISDVFASVVSRGSPTLGSRFTAEVSVLVSEGFWIFEF